ncbi:replication initiator protein [Microviridae sp.]|nr:replication initiator protein [Microviridae sp.]
MCDSPIYVKKNKYLPGVEIPVGCGKCPPCKKRRVDSWVFRLMQEDKVSTYSHFLTLTYDNENVPRTKNKYLTLKKKDPQDFMKRLRKNTGIKGIKYYLAAEYGELNNRPHYHLIIFNVREESEYDKAWQKGEIHAKPVSGNGIAYTVSYLDKKKGIPLHERDDRTEEYSTMSQGLGKAYINDQTKRYHSENLERNYITLPGGYRIAIPRYYRDKLFDEQEKTKQMGIIKNAMDHEEAYNRYQAELKGLDYDDIKYEQGLHKRRQFERKNSKNRKL